MQGGDAEQCGAIGAIAYVGSHDVQTLDDDMAATNLVNRENLHLARSGDGGKPDRAQGVDSGVVEDRPAVRVDLDPQPHDLVVPAEPNAVHVSGEDQRRFVSTGGELLPGHKL